MTWRIPPVGYCVTCLVAQREENPAFVLWKGTGLCVDHLRQTLLPEIADALSGQKGAAGLTVEDLDALPVGSVVLDGAVVHERCAWTKTDDTCRVDDEGEVLRTAWASVQWTMDRTSGELIDEFGPIILLWEAGR